MKNYNFKFSKSNSTTFNLIRAICTHIITLTHAREAFITLEKKNLLGATSLGLLFLLSGILISYSTFRRLSQNREDFKGFFLRRFSRIYPPLIVALFLALLIDGYVIFIVLEEKPNDAYSLEAFIASLLLLNDSAIGVTAFGTLRPLWVLPLFWWIYITFGWILLGKKTVQKTYFYYIILGFFIFILIIICLGFHNIVKLGYIIIWLIGVAFSYILGRLDNYFRKKQKNSSLKRSNSVNQIKRKIQWSSLCASIIFFILAVIRYMSYGNQFGLIYYILLSISFCAFFVFSQYSSFQYPQKLKKTINFMASYSFTLYLLNYTFFNFYRMFRQEINSYVLLIIVYIITNLISILIASFTEIQTSNITSYLMKKID
jgi:peptidoglycan/LPS O-acetylase OafA/YrhL